MESEVCIQNEALICSEGKSAKEFLSMQLQELEDDLNIYLAGNYSIKLSNKKDFSNWVNSHSPFHWLIEFYGIMSRGGFDVVIGNPPYVE